MTIETKIKKLLCITTSKLWYLNRLNSRLVSLQTNSVPQLWSALVYLLKRLLVIQIKDKPKIHETFFFLVNKIMTHWENQMRKGIHKQELTQKQNPNQINAGKIPETDRPRWVMECRTIHNIEFTKTTNKRTAKNQEKSKTQVRNWTQKNS